MSAIITRPPVLIDRTYFSRMTFTEEGGAQGRIMASGGPWIVGTNLYMFLEGGGIASGLTPLKVYKSTDNGSTWIPKDDTSINAPPTPTNDPAQNTSVFDSVSGKIFVTYMGDGSTHRLQVYTFNTHTDLWETPGTQSSVDSQNEWFVEARLSNGDIYCFYSFTAFGGTTVYEKYSGGAWTTTVIDTHTDCTGVESVLVDSSDRMHFVYQRGSSTRFLNYVQISSAGSVGTITTLYTNTAAGGGGGFGVGRGVVWGTHVEFPAFIYGGSSVPVIVFEGAPVAAPVWGTRNVGSAVVSPSFSAALDSTLDHNGNLVVGWNEVQVGGIQDNMWIATDTGSGFGTQVLFYDGVANPLSVPGISVTSPTHSLYLAQDASGNWFALTAVDMYDGTSSPCGGIFLTSIGTYTLFPSCPSTNTMFIGTSYNGTLIASGGNGTYAFKVLS